MGTLFSWSRLLSAGKQTVSLDALRIWVRQECWQTDHLLLGEVGCASLLLDLTAERK